MRPCHLRVKKRRLRTKNDLLAAKKKGSLMGLLKRFFEDKYLTSVNGHFSDLNSQISVFSKGDICIECALVVPWIFPRFSL
jgi:hypothetical protein